jgi:hypothetical protein
MDPNEDAAELIIATAVVDRAVQCPHCGTENDILGMLGNLASRVDPDGEDNALSQSPETLRIRGLELIRPEEDSKFFYDSLLLVNCSCCDREFTPAAKLDTQTVSIYLFKYCPCGYGFDFRYPKDQESLRIVPFIGVPFARCPQCHSTVIFEPEKGWWRYQVLVVVLSAFKAVKRLLLTGSCNGTGARKNGGTE